ncbi:MAG: hypothetical protein LH467_04305 [Gemmatimonadaceae bacterium]|nr:hypothetical protein [Gemmatimonadaceae bacterium]
MSVAHAGGALPLSVLLLGLTVAGTQRARVPLLQYLSVGSHRIPFESPDGSAARFRFVDQALGLARRPSAAVDARAMSSCYRPIADPIVGPMTLLFESDEMGHPEWLTEFELIPAGNRPDVERGCQRINVASTAIVTDRGIRLGLTRAAVLRLLGPPERDHDGVAEFEQLSERVVRTGGSVDRNDLFSALTVTFRDGRVVAFSGAVGDTD